MNICTTCGSPDPPKTVTPESILVEAFLFLCGIVPGLLYGVWRAGNRHKACRHCGGKGFAPADSPFFKGRTC